MKFLRAALLLALAGGALPAAAAVPVPPRPDRYATDKAGVTDAARLSALNEKLAAFERETSSQVLVYVDRRLPADTSVEEFAAASLKAWGVGQKGKDNGVVLFAFVDDRKFRIEVGYGLEGAIPDARARAIQEETVLPLFKKGDFTGGLEGGAGALMKAARGEAYAGTGKTVAEAAPTGPLPAWLVLIPLAGAGLGFIFARRVAPDERVRRAMFVGVPVTVFALMVAGILLADPRVIAMDFGILPLVAAFAIPRVMGRGTHLRGRRRIGLGLLQAGVGALILTLALFLFAVGWGALATPAVLLALLVVPLLLVGCALKAEDLLRTSTVATGRLAFLALLPAALWLLICTLAQTGGVLAAGAAALTIFALWLGSWLLARARGWRLLPRIEWSSAATGAASSAGSASSSSSWSSSGSDSSWSSSSGSGSSSFSGGGGESGGGGSSGSW